MTPTWGVTVYRNSERVVTIEGGYLAGREITPEDEDAIRCAAESLLAFIDEPVAPKYFDNDPRQADALRHKLLADIFEPPIWYRGKDRVVTPPWHALTINERDLIADALAQWKKRQ